VAHPDAFALKNSSLNEFLFADVGTELNGSPLTILSVLARLGHDPWTEAARWAELPTRDAAACLARSIAQMPLMPQALADAPATAARLVLSLTPHNRAPASTAGAGAIVQKLPKWTPLMFLYCALAIGMAVNVILTQKPAATVTTPIAQSIGKPAPMPGGS